MLPSVKTLETIADNCTDAKLIRAVLELFDKDGPGSANADEWRDLQAKDLRWARLDVPYSWRGYHNSHRVRLALEFCDRILGTCGVESAIDDPHGFSPHNGPDYAIDYCNTGDTYGLTLCYVTTPKRDYFTVASWGDILEALEKRGAKFQ